MAEEAVYGAGGESNKRKYNESPPPMTRRTTGFSSAPDFAAPPSSYNSIPPPPNEIELAKQKAQEIAARLLNNSDPSKRARVENGADVGGGFDAYDSGSGMKHSGLGLGGPPQSASYGYPVPSKKIEIPNGRVGLIIGKGGDTIKYLQMESGAKIQVTRDTDVDLNSATRTVELTGGPDQIAKAEQMIKDVLAEAEAGSSGIVNRRVTGPVAGAERFSMMVPNNKVGLVIGKGGETIKSMQAGTGARIQVIPLHLPPGDMSKERTVQIDGTSEQIEAAKQLIEEVTSENRMRNPSMGYNSQQGYQTRPPTNWAPPMQQPGYGYTQPGYPPQYNMNQQQPNYPGYTWDQSQTQTGGGYDYYNTQPPTQQTQGGSGSTDYSYNNPYGQGYGQDGGYGYNNYSQQQTTGYNQPPPPQGYNNAEGKNPSSDSSIQAPPTQPSPNPNDPGYGYGTQPASGYGGNVTPQGQKAGGGYVQPQKSPSSQGGGGGGGGGYGQYPPPPVQMGGYDGGAQRPPYAAPPQSGYGAPPYGYGQQAAYGGGYGGGYGGAQQAPGYSTDAIAPPTSGAPKALPPS